MFALGGFLGRKKVNHKILKCVLKLCKTDGKYLLPLPTQSANTLSSLQQLKNMNNILTVITVHSAKSDTTHQLSKKKMREEENRIIIPLLICKFEMYLKLGCPLMTLFNRTGTSCE